MDIYKQNRTQLHNEIFSFLCLNAGEKMSQREIAIKLGVSPTAIANSLEGLNEDGLIKIEETKTANFISFNRDEEKAINMKRAENMRQIYFSGLISFLENEFAGGAIILFGSYSRGEDTISSDIDIAIIGRKDKLIKIEKYEKILNRKININFYESWGRINKNLKNNILNGIVFSGGVEL